MTKAPGRKRAAKSEGDGGTPAKAANPLIGDGPQTGPITAKEVAGWFPNEAMGRPSVALCADLAGDLEVYRNLREAYPPKLDIEGAWDHWAKAGYHARNLRDEVEAILRKFPAILDGVGIRPLDATAPDDALPALLPLGTFLPSLNLFIEICKTRGRGRPPPPWLNFALRYAPDIQSIQVAHLQSKQDEVLSTAQKSANADDEIARIASLNLPIVSVKSDHGPVAMVLTAAVYRFFGCVVDSSAIGSALERAGQNQK